MIVNAAAAQKESPPDIHPRLSGGPIAPAPVFSNLSIGSDYLRLINFARMKPMPTATAAVPSGFLAIRFSRATAANCP
jgi:hypothetical protein